MGAQPLGKVEGGFRPWARLRGGQPLGKVEGGAQLQSVKPFNCSYKECVSALYSRQTLSLVTVANSNVPHYTVTVRTYFLFMCINHHGCTACLCVTSIIIGIFDVFVASE